MEIKWLRKRLRELMVPDHIETWEEYKSRQEKIQLILEDIEKAKQEGK